MFNLPRADELNELTKVRAANCVTMYIPFSESYSSAEPMRIHLKNYIRDAETILIDRKVSPDQIRKILEPIRILIDDHALWAQRTHSMVLFANIRMCKAYTIPHDLPAVLAVQKGFVTKPLADIMATNAHYYVLALSHNHVKLFEGDQFQLKELHPDNFPTDMKQTLRIDEYPNWQETHEIAPSYMGKGSEAFHGQYNVRQTDKIMLTEFFRRLDKRVSALLSRSGAPLLIAGVNYLLPLYRQVNTYPRLLPGYIKGNLERASLDTIRQKAWPTVAGTV